MEPLKTETNVTVFLGGTRFRFVHQDPATREDGRDDMWACYVSTDYRGREVFHNIVDSVRVATFADFATSDTDPDTPCDD